MYKSDSFRPLILLVGILLISGNFIFAGLYFKSTETVKLQNQKYSELEELTQQYLSLENQSCAHDSSTSACLNAVIEQYGKKEGQDCSSVPDNICPRWCAAGADYDCCTQNNYQWISGRGCYSK